MLNDCEYEGAYVEVKLKGNEKRRSSTRNNTSTANASMLASEDMGAAGSIIQIQ